MDFFYILLLIFILIVICKPYNLKCPYPSQREIRAKAKCNKITAEYWCLFEKLRRKSFVERCEEKQDYTRLGHKYVISGSLEEVNCSDSRYQPFSLWSNVSSECILKKSTCGEIGQINYSKGTCKEDASCRCDHTKGYAFITKPRNLCFCNPSVEDCSCYLKRCLNKRKLSSEYTCIFREETTEKCHQYKGKPSNGTQRLSINLVDDSNIVGIEDTYRRTSTIVVLVIIFLTVIWPIIYYKSQENASSADIKPPTTIKAFAKDSEIRLCWSEVNLELSNKTFANVLYEIEFTTDDWKENNPPHTTSAREFIFDTPAQPATIYRFRVCTYITTPYRLKSKPEETLLRTEEIRQPEKVLTVGNKGNIILKWAPAGQSIFKIEKYKIEVTSNDWKNIWREDEVDATLPMEWVLKKPELSKTYRFKVYTYVCGSFKSEPTETLFHADSSCFEMEIPIVNREFTGEMKNKKSKQYDDVKKELTSRVQQIFDKTEGTQTVIDCVLRPGSIIAVLTIFSAGYHDKQKLQMAIKDCIKGGMLGSFQIIPERFSFKPLNYPLSPKNVTAKLYGGNISISWSEQETFFKTEKFRIQYSTDMTDDLKNSVDIFVAGKEDKAYISDVLPSKTYKIKVFSRIHYEIESDFPSAETVVKTSDLSPPENLSSVFCEGNIKISWDKPEERFFKTEFFRIQYSTDNWNSSDDILVSGKENTADISDVLPSSLYNIKVFTRIHSEIESLASTENTVATCDMLPVTRVRCTKESEGIRLFWTNPTFPSLKIIKHYRVNISDESRQSIDIRDVPADQKDDEMTWLFKSKLRYASFNIAVCTTNNSISELSEVIVYNLKRKPMPPRNVTKKTISTGIQIAWDKPSSPTEHYIKQFRIYTTTAGENRCNVVSKGTSTFEVPNERLKRNAFYYFRISTCSNDNFESELSNAVTHHTAAPLFNRTVSAIEQRSSNSNV